MHACMRACPGTLTWLPAKQCCDDSFGLSMHARLFWRADLAACRQLAACDTAFDHGAQIRSDTICMVQDDADRQTWQDLLCQLGTIANELSFNDSQSDRLT